MHFKCTGYSHTHIPCTALVKTTVVCQRCELWIVEEAQWKNELAENQVTVSYNTHTHTQTQQAFRRFPFPLSITCLPPTLPHLRLSLPGRWVCPPFVGRIVKSQRSNRTQRNYAKTKMLHLGEARKQQLGSPERSVEYGKQNRTGNKMAIHTEAYMHAHTLAGKHKSKRGLAASG